MNNIKYVVAGALVLLGVLVLGGTLADPAPKATDQASAAAGGTLRIGVDGTEPAFYKVDGVAKGFDYEMALGVAEGMGVKPEFVVMGFGDLFPALEAGKIDVIGAQVTETAERKEDFDFTAPYFVTYLSFLTPEDSDIKNRSDVNGKNVAIVDGTIQERYLAEQYKDVNIIKAKDEDAAVSAIQSGKADAFFYDAPYTAPIIKRAPIKLKEAIVYPADDAPISFVMQKGDNRRAQIDKALEDMILNGEWLKIKKEYFREYPLSEVFKDKGA
ncbi:amino acid ABC transporter substrate-binding protein (PAAT family) [Nocardioides albertanoniae]|uniref:Amino acid ABC transporter substrate-binding protein (PAAT family) n=1 Tax=Nocardioides albertanoniae TaxID=1175486 RepID=A0A543A3Y9_9ACTN|nr:transporter substrate-binding domain-containing protein [Nocardioides albertanoniae]TQL67299.1 amino acid ABC transporter substrate-binding protein (PAAT family) [Nocardioides albertanoniae]